jgi:hypothetical protein
VTGCGDCECRRLKIVGLLLIGAMAFCGLEWREFSSNRMLGLSAAGLMFVM